MLTELINRISSNTVTDCDLSYIAKHFIEVCQVTSSLNSVFALMTEQYLPQIIKDILCKEYYISEFDEEQSLKTNIKLKIVNHFKKYGTIFFAQFDVNIFIKSMLKINFNAEISDNQLWNVFTFLNFLKYDILGNYIITINNNILNKYTLYYATKLPLNIIAHYMTLYNSRFIDSGHAHYDHNKDLCQSIYLKNHCSTNVSYKLIYIDLYAKKNDLIVDTYSIHKILNISIANNYYDIFMDCYNTGVILK